MIDTKRLQEIDDRSKATSGEPWWTKDDPTPQESGVVYDGRGTCVSCVAVFGNPEDECGEYDESNAEFAAHAHADVPDLLAEVRELREELLRMAKLAEPPVDDGEPYVLRMTPECRNALLALGDGAEASS